jgi:hypothetical protein
LGQPIVTNLFFFLGHVIFSKWNNKKNGGTTKKGFQILLFDDKFNDKLSQTKVYKFIMFKGKLNPATKEQSHLFMPCNPAALCIG